jgi:hypothetical protein
LLVAKALRLVLLLSLLLLFVRFVESGDVSGFVFLPPAAETQELEDGGPGIYAVVGEGILVFQLFARIDEALLDYGDARC